MNTRIVVDGNAVYEIDEECEKKKDEATVFQFKNTKDDVNRKRGNNKRSGRL